MGPATPKLRRERHLRLGWVLQPIEMRPLPLGVPT